MLVRYYASREQCNTGVLSMDSNTSGMFKSLAFGMHASALLTVKMWEFGRHIPDRSEICLAPSGSFLRPYCSEFVKRQTLTALKLFGLSLYPLA